MTFSQASLFFCAIKVISSRSKTCWDVSYLFVLIRTNIVIYPNPCIIISVIHIPSLHIRESRFAAEAQNPEGVEFSDVPWVPLQTIEFVTPNKWPKDEAQRRFIQIWLVYIAQKKKSGLSLTNMSNKMWRNTLGTCDPLLLFALNPKETCLFAFISATGNNESVAHFSPFIFSWVVIGNFLFFGNIYIKSMCPVGKEVNLGS